ncbi:MAG: hypothetical protein ACRDXF_03135, partial [Acidimicrobiia bacterium]
MATSPSVLAREAGTSAPTTRSARYRPSLSHLAIGLAAALAFVLNFLALQSRDATTLVAIADSSIAAGSPLTPDVVRLVPLSAEFEGLEHLVLEADLEDLEGWIVGRTVREGELIDRSVVSRPGAGDQMRTMSIPVAAEHAAGATLVIGDRVDVISMVTDEPVFVATDLEVVSIADTAQTGLSGTVPYHVVVGVSPDQALSLARAIADGSMEILRS